MFSCILHSLLVYTSCQTQKAVCQWDKSHISWCVAYWRIHLQHFIFKFPQIFICDHFIPPCFHLVELAVREKENSGARALRKTKTTLNVARALPDLRQPRKSLSAEEIEQRKQKVLPCLLVSFGCAQQILSRVLMSVLTQREETMARKVAEAAEREAKKAAQRKKKRWVLNLVVHPKIGIILM